MIPGDRTRTNGRTLLGDMLWFNIKKNYLSFAFKTRQKSLVSELEFKKS